MADSERKLGIPIYDVGIAPDGATHDDEDVIDVEVIEDEPTLNERLRARARDGAEAVSETLRNVRMNGLRDAFFTHPADTARAAAGTADPRVQERQQGRAGRRAQARAQAAQTAEAKRARSERERLTRAAREDPLSKLKLETLQAGEAYMDSLRRSGLLDAGQSQESQRKQLSGLHQIYASMMVLQCVRPLQQGISAQNVVSALGMGASMWMLSPNFRTQVGALAGQIGDAIQSKIAERGEKKDAKAQERFDKLSSQGKADRLPSRWRKRLDRVQFAQRGHRLPFTAQSAAMTEVALAEAAYADMRRPGADRDAVEDRYQSALSALYGYVDSDGIDREDVSRSARVIIGQRMAKDPKIASVFAELGHGRFTRSEPRQVTVEGSTEQVTIWTQDFVDVHEERTVKSGSFRVRPPMTVDEHRARAGETLTIELMATTTPEEMNTALSQYMVASSAGRFPEAGATLEDADARRRFGRARTMFASMADDGLSPDDQRFAYSAAYVDAVEVVQTLKPELAAQWTARYGENWKEKVAEDIKQFNDAAAADERAQGGAEPGSPWERFTARRPAASYDASESARRGEDIHDAVVVEEQAEERLADPAARTPRPFGAPRRQREATSHVRAVDDTVHDGELFAEDTASPQFADEIEGEVVGDTPLPPARRWAALVAGSSDAATADQAGVARATAAKIRKARVNQHYNEIETGRVTGIGRDDAEPLQDVDFQLG